MGVFIEARGNVWDMAGSANAMCILTNTTVKKDGCLVMGAGLAKQAALRFPRLPAFLGNAVTMGEQCLLPLYDFNWHGAIFIAFPTKNDWRKLSQPAAILLRCNELMKLIEDKNWTRVLLPRPGCGKGRLVWEDIKPLLLESIDERVTVVTY